MIAANQLSSSRNLLKLTRRYNNHYFAVSSINTFNSGHDASAPLHSASVSSYWKCQGSLCSHDRFSYYDGLGLGQTITMRNASGHGPSDHDNNAQNNKTSKRHGSQRNHKKSYHKKQHRTPFHSVRLISESAARRTTQHFIQLQKEPFQTNIRNNQTPWRDRASVLAAEQALEFWAHKNNRRHRARGGEPTNNNDYLQQLENDANTVLDLFTSLHHFHIQEGMLLDGGVSVITNGMYSHVIDALSKSSKMEHVSEADRLLRQFISLYLLENHATENKNQNDLQSKLHDLGLPHTTDSEKCIGLSMPPSISWSYKDKHHFPNQIRITGVMRGLVRQLCPIEAESLLHLKIQLASTLQRNLFEPNEIGYATVIDGYSRATDGENAERILELMKDRYGDGTNGANVVAYNAAISAWARSASREEDNVKSRNAAENAERLLREMWSLPHDQSNDRFRHQILPDVVSYSSVISAYASCSDGSFGLKRAEELLSELEGLAEREGNESIHDLNQQQQTSTSKSRGGGRHPCGFQLNSTVYNALLQAYANIGDTESAEKLLNRMITLHSHSSKEGGGGPFKNVRPNTRTFNVVLNTWAKSGTREAGPKANELLFKMEEMSAVYRDRINQPDIISYNTVLSAWSKSAGYDQNSAKDAETVGVNAAYKASDLLDRIESQSYRIKPDRISYNTTISAFANAAQACTTGILMAQKADALISRMKDRGIEPDDYSFNGVLLAWSRSSGDSSSSNAKHCESLLRSMRNPTNVSWSTVINAYAHAGCAEEAASLLSEMEDNALDSMNHRSSSVTPKTLPVVVYNNVIHAWSRSTDENASKHAEAILNRLEENGSNRLNLPKPDVVSYLSVLNALEHTKDPNKAERSKSILDRLVVSDNVQSTIDNRLRENIQRAYNRVLSACAYTPTNAGEHARNNAAKILVQTFRDLNSREDISVGPNQESFSVFLQGCTHLFLPSSSERRLLMTSALRECCGRGLLNEKIWDKFCDASSGEEMESFLSGLGTVDRSFAALPCDWSRRRDDNKLP